MRYLRRHGQLTGGRIYGWVYSIRRNGGFTLKELEVELSAMRDENLIACTNGQWWIRQGGIKK